MLVTNKFINTVCPKKGYPFEASASVEGSWPVPPSPPPKKKKIGTRNKTNIPDAAGAALEVEGLLKIFPWWAVLIGSHKSVKSIGGPEIGGF